MQVNKKISGTEWIRIAVILIIFITLRLISWEHAATVEDHDSISYLNDAKYISSHQFENLTSVTTFFYPVMISNVSLLGINLESAARLISLLFSLILFFSIYFIGKKITNPKSVLFGLLLISFSPFLITNSISILSEPSYYGLVYFGFLILWYSLMKPKIFTSLFAGLIFGLAFSDRTEGIIFFFCIPVIYLIYFKLKEKEYFTISKTSYRIALFIIGFSLVAAPIITFVSSRMGSFNINGRTAWEVLLKASDVKSYEEKSFGLDFSPIQTNYDYVISHSNTNLKSANTFPADIKLFFYNVYQLSKSKLSSIAGIFVLIFFGIGVYHLVLIRNYEALILIFTFTTIVLIPPMMLSYFVERHIGIAAPLIMLVAGIGVNETACLFKTAGKKDVNLLLRKKFLIFIEKSFGFFLILFMVIISLGWMNDALRHPSPNQEYRYSDYIKPLKILKNDIYAEKISNLKVLTRKSYFTYFSETKALEIPFTDYDGLVRYTKLNHGNYLFLEYKYLKDYPFIKKFEQGEHPQYLLMFEGKDVTNSRIELYKFQK